jgi:hypothetical protein
LAVWETGVRVPVFQGAVGAASVWRRPRGCGRREWLRRPSTAAAVPAPSTGHFEAVPQTRATRLSLGPAQARAPGASGLGESAWCRLSRSAGGEREGEAHGPGRPWASSRLHFHSINAARNPEGRPILTHSRLEESRTQAVSVRCVRVGAGRGAAAGGGDRPVSAGRGCWRLPAFSARLEAAQDRAGASPADPALPYARRLLHGLPARPHALRTPAAHAR